MGSDRSNFEKRKVDHITLSLDPRTQISSHANFDLVKLHHNALPELNLSDVNLSTKILGADFNSPHFISSMTAGHKQALKINLNLAKAAHQNKWLMAVGSQRKELNQSLKSRESEWSHIKDQFPETQFVSNIGLEQVILEKPEVVLNLMNSIDALGLIIHLNPLQEAFQNFDQACFKGGLKAIEKLCQKSKKPIIIKEVGFGIDAKTSKKLLDIGVSVIDVSGRGGTHWGLLEGLRAQDGDLQTQILSKASHAFTDWGLTALESLLDCQKLVKKHAFWASGGFRNGVQSAKALCLGAKAVGVAQPLMKAAIESSEATLFEMKRFDYELKVALFAMGVKKVDEVQKSNSWSIDRR